MSELAHPDKNPSYVRPTLLERSAEGARPGQGSQLCPAQRGGRLHRRSRRRFSTTGRSFHAANATTSPSRPSPVVLRASMGGRGARGGRVSDMLWCRGGRSGKHLVSGTLQRPSSRCQAAPLHQHARAVRHYAGRALESGSLHSRLHGLNASTLVLRVQATRREEHARGPRARLLQGLLMERVGTHLRGLPLRGSTALPPRVHHGAPCAAPVQVPPKLVVSQSSINPISRVTRQDLFCTTYLPTDRPSLNPKP